MKHPHRQLTACLIISTYNAPEQLKLCLKSVLQQTRQPDEIIIIDDGSGPATKRLIDLYRPLFACPLRHEWQEDKGFRKCRIYNQGLRVCTSDYVVLIDGDIILDRHFMEDHVRIAQRGYCVAGSRANIRPDAAMKFLDKETIKLCPFSRGVERRLNALRLPFLYFLTKHYYFNRPFRKFRGTNMAAFLDDLKAINGFDEDFEGYYGEDTDLGMRLHNLGVKRHFAKWICVEYHIKHPRKKVTERNKEMLQRNRNRIRCEHGMDSPSPDIRQELTIDR